MAYVLPVAPAMSAQLAPAALHRDHWYVSVIGVAPVHVPSLAVRTPPCVSVPLTVGGVAFEGGEADAVTVTVWVEVADDDPPPFVAVTTARNVEPTSLATTRYVDEVAPARSEHAPPEASHRRH
jgi:hypothetical protein